MSDRDWKLFISDISESIFKINKYITGLTYEEFIKDDKSIDAVIRNFGIIGEAANKIPDVIKDKLENIDWNKITGLRNRVIHDYFGVDLEIIWYIIENELKLLESEINKLI